jgi:hypothetical protein
MFGLFLDEPHPSGLARRMGLFVAAAAAEAISFRSASILVE